MLSDKENAKALGVKGENAVAEYLRQHGYIIVKRNWKDKFGEIDIIAENKNCVAFVEVKTRKAGSMVSGEEAVDEAKQRRVRNTGIMFIKRFNTELPARFDVAEVTVSKDTDGKEKWMLKYTKNAF